VFWLSAPAVTMAQAKALRALIERDLPDLVLPQPRTDVVEEIRVSVQGKEKAPTKEGPEDIKQFGKEE